MEQLLRPLTENGQPVRKVEPIGDLRKYVIEQIAGLKLE
jgi:hypothetical protein